MIVRAGLFKLAGGFDSSFFAHFEEIDLCWRLKNRGYRIRYVPSSVVYHLGGGTLSYTNPRKTYLNFRNSFVCLAKNANPRIYFRVLFIRFLLDGISGVRFLLKAEIRNLFAVLKAHWAFYGKLNRIRIFRKKESKFISSYQHSEIYKKSLVFTYFVKKKYTFNALNWKVNQG